MYRLHLLGGVSLRSSDGPLEGRVVQRRQLALLSILSTSHRAPLTREKLVGLMWPETAEENARHLLSDTLYVIRQNLGSQAVVAVGEGLRLGPETVWSDVAAFEAAVDEGRLDEAVELYAGPFLDGFYLHGSGEFERWAEAERRHLRERYREALESLAAGAAAEGDLEGAVRWWRRRAEGDPLNSRVAVRLAEALAAAGNRAGAVAHAREHAALLREELDVEPPAEMKAVLARSTAPAELARPSRRAEAATETGGDRADHRHPIDTPEPESVAVRPGSGRRPGIGTVIASVGIIAVLLTTGVLVLRRGAAVGQRDGDPPRSAGAVAVLPLEVEGDDPEEIRFAAGLTDDLLTRLSRVDGVRVIAGEAVRRYREVGKSGCELAETLGARGLVEGTVRRNAGRIRINVRLLDPCEATYLWSRAYERELSDIFAVQADVAQNVAHALGVTLTSAEAASLGDAPTDDLRAWDYLTWARAVLAGPSTAEDRAFGEELVRRALALDPDLGEACGLLGIFFAMRSRTAEPPLRWLGDPDAPRPTWDDSVRLYAGRAISLAPDDPSGYRGLQLLHNLRQEFPEALDAGLRVLELSPSHASALFDLGSTYAMAGDFLTSFLWRHLAGRYNPDRARAYEERAEVKYILGDLETAKRWLRMARRLDPEGTYASMLLAEIESSLGRSAAARREIQGILARDPGGRGCGAGSRCRVLALGVAARVELDAREYGAAEAYLLRLLDGDPPVEYLPSGFGEILSVRTALGYARLQRGDEHAGRATLEESRRRAFEHLRDLERRGEAGGYSAYMLSRVHALLGQPEAAVRWLREADARGWRWGFTYNGRRDPMLQSLRGYPAFEELAASVDRRLAEDRAELERLEVLPADSLYRVLVDRARRDAASGAE